MEKTKSIFDLENRLDIYEEYTTFIRNIQKSKMIATKYKITIADYLNQAFSSWPHREGTYTIWDYLDRKQINPEDEQQCSISEQEKCLYAFELYYNILKWGSELDRGPGLGDGFCNYVSAADVLASTVENLDWLFDQFNYVIREREAEKFCQYIITKRDSDVDAAIEAAPELAEYLRSVQKVCYF